MIAISRRQKLLGGVFVIFSAAWAIDMLSGGPGPSPAEATLSPLVTGGPTEPPPDPADLEDLIEALQREQATRVALPFAQVRRDLFVPTEQFEAVLLLVADEALAKAAEQPERSMEKPPPFESRHVLKGVLTGRVPLALIDGVLVRAGAQIDGYRVVEIHPDFVVLRQGQNPVVRLQLARAGEH